MKQLEEQFVQMHGIIHVEKSFIIPLLCMGVK